MNNNPARARKLSANENNNAKLKIGLLVDSDSSDKYVYELAEWGQSQDDLSISHFIIQQRESSNRGKFSGVIDIVKNKGLREALRIFLWSLIEKLESARIKKDTFKDHLQTFDLSKVLPNSITISPNISASGLVHRFSDDDISRVRALNLDLLIRCGSGILRGDILCVTRLGILSFHHADNRINRGGPPGFWEVYLRQNKTGFIIQQLTEDLDGGNVLIRGAFPTQNYYLLNQAHLYTRSNFYMKQLLLSIARTSRLPGIEDPFPYFNRLYRAPQISVELKYLAQFVQNKVRALQSRTLSRKKNRWGVAFCRSDWRNLVMWRGTKIVNPPNHFLADPFVMTESNRDYCFVEDFDFKTSRGCISVYELKDKSATRLGEAIVEPFHMSFPFVFRFDSKIYMVPETCENRDIRLYECVDFPHQWKLVKVIMSDISAVDTMIFNYGEFWWLFTNINPAGTDDHCSELFIFYSDNPITGDWISHKRNPVTIDPSRARNAGILLCKNDVYRVAQRQGFRQYGEGFSINKISLLSKDEYLERELGAVEPNFFQNLKGTHHLHSNGKISVFDYVEEIRID